MTERLTYRVHEAVALSGLSRLTIERRIGDGTLKSHKVGRARLIEAESLKAWLYGGEKSQPEPKAKAQDNPPKRASKRGAFRGRRRANMRLPSHLQ